MSTFQRILILFAFTGLGLAAAALIVQAPHLPFASLSQSSAANQAPRDDDRLVVKAGADESSGEWIVEDTPALDELPWPITGVWNAGEPSQENDFPNAPRRLMFADDGPIASTLPTAPLPTAPLPSADAAPTAPLPAQVILAQNIAAESVRDEPATPLDLPGDAAATGEELALAVPADSSLLTSQRSFPDEGDGRLDINIPNTDIREVLQLLSKAGDLNILASKNVTGQVKATLTGVDVDTALAAILRSTGYVARREDNFVYVGTADDFLAMDHALDRVSTRVYRPNYITAAELQSLITPMLTPVVGSISVSSPAEVGIASDATNSGGDNFAGAEVILVRDYEGSLVQIDQVFHEVDRRPLQVSIEAMILSVKLSDEHTLGVDWDLLRSNNNVRLVVGSPQANLGAINANNSGLVFGYLDSNLGFFLDALEKIGETHVISQPRLMCLNKQRAEIHIGEERGYISTTVTETSATQSVEFLEVGTQLRLRPFISSDGLIRMEVHPELSTGTVEVSENFTLPNKTVTQVTTNVMIRDGATLVIGGLLREDLQMDTEQVPLLGSLPVIGPLFRSKTDKIERDEIVVLITPRIVWEPEFNCQGEYADCEFHHQHAIMADKMSPISRNFYGRKYRRLAKAAWIAGDAKSALRYINLSIHFNRLDRESTQLRAEIVAGSGLGDASVHSHLKEGMLHWRHPLHGAGLSNWVLDEMHGPHSHLGQEPAPGNDPGVSGPARTLDVPEAVRPGEVVEGELISPDVE